MIDKMIVLKQDKPVFFKLILILLILPLLGLAIVAVVNPAIRSWLVSSAKRLMDKTQKKDEELKNQIEDAQKEIDKLEEKKEDVDQKLETIKNDDDADWHKKVKK